jgi:hypothetical protein
MRKTVVEVRCGAVRCREVVVVVVVCVAAAGVEEWRLAWT